MTALADIARALTEEADQLDTDQELSIPIDVDMHVHLLRQVGSAELLLAVSRRVASNEGDAPARLEALLRLTADTRWVDALVGGVDAEGAERVMATRAEPLDALQAEWLLQRMLKRLAPDPEGAGGPESEAPTVANLEVQGVPASWLRA